MAVKGAGTKGAGAGFQPKTDVMVVQRLRGWAVWLLAERREVDAKAPCGNGIGADDLGKVEAPRIGAVDAAVDCVLVLAGRAACSWA